MIYKLIENSKGNRWTLDGKFIAEAEVPEGAKKLSKKQCMFCDSHGDHQRLALGMMLPICDNHYYSTTLGALVAQAREKGLLNGIH